MSEPTARRVMILLIGAVVIVLAIGAAGFAVTATTSSTPVQPTDSAPPSAAGSYVIRSA